MRPSSVIFFLGCLALFTGIATGPTLVGWLALLLAIVLFMLSFTT